MCIGCPPDEDVGFGRRFDSSFADSQVESQRITLRIAGDYRYASRPSRSNDRWVYNHRLDDRRFVDEDLRCRKRYMPG